MNATLHLLASSWNLFSLMAPYLLLGFTIAGILSVILTPAWVYRHLGGRGIRQVIKAAVFGVPLPLCSCGVIPVAASLRQHGASRGATAGFLLSTPQTGVDSILATYGLIGGALGAAQGLVFAVVRVVMALLSGTVGGSVITLACDPDEEEHTGVPDSPAPPGTAAPAATEAGETPARRPLKTILAQIIGHAYVTLPRDIARPLLIGILIAGLISTLLSPGVLSPYLGGGVLAMLAMMVVGIPMYVCATTSLPLAIGFMHMGASPGAALVFLIAGPATNAATLTTIYKLLGSRSLLLYLLTIVVASLAGGLGTDAVFARLDLGAAVTPLHLHGHGGLGAGIRHGAAVVLLGILLWGLLRSWLAPSTPGTKTTPAETEDSMELAVRGMTCDHCAQTVRLALSGLAGVREVSVDRPGGRVHVVSDRLAAGVLLDAVRKAGYEADVCGDGGTEAGACPSCEESAAREKTSPPPDA